MVGSELNRTRGKRKKKNCSIFLASKSSVHSFTVKTLVIFHVIHHVTALDQ